jgi:hypothetical protein
VTFHANRRCSPQNFRAEAGVPARREVFQVLHKLVVSLSSLCMCNVELLWKQEQSFERSLADARVGRVGLGSAKRFQFGKCGGTDFIYWGRGTREPGDRVGESGDDFVCA